MKENSGVIVTDSVTSDGLTQFIECLGGCHLRYKRGYKNVIDKCRELNETGAYSPLAMETSGHAAFKENYYLDDGAYLVTKLLIALAGLNEGESLTDLISTLPEPAESDEVRISFNEQSADFRADGEKVIEELTEKFRNMENIKLAENNYEGVRINFPEDCGNGWLLVRVSLHDPVLPLNFESGTKGGNRIMAEKLYRLLKDYPFLNTDNLLKFIHN